MEAGAKLLHQLLSLRDGIPSGVATGYAGYAPAYPAKQDSSSVLVYIYILLYCIYAVFVKRKKKNKHSSTPSCLVI